jgi:hypothetical protein
MRINVPWPLSTTAKAFIAAQPAHVQPMVENYVGIDPSWRNETMIG